MGYIFTVNICGCHVGISVYQRGRTAAGPHNRQNERETPRSNGADQGAISPCSQNIWILSLLYTVYCTVYSTPIHLPHPSSYSSSGGVLPLPPLQIYITSVLGLLYTLGPTSVRFYCKGYFSKSSNLLLKNYENTSF